jgi:hypothetical protein
MKQAYRRRASIWDWLLLCVVLPLCLLALAIAEVTR